MPKIYSVKYTWHQLQEGTRYNKQTELILYPALKDEENSTPFEIYINGVKCYSGATGLIINENNATLFVNSTLKN